MPKNTKKAAATISGDFTANVISDRELRIQAAFIARDLNAHVHGASERTCENVKETYTVMFKTVYDLLQ